MLFRDRDHGVVKCEVIRVFRKTVRREKDERRCDRRALVAVQKCLRFGKVKSVRGSNVKEIAASVEIRVLRRSESRFHETAISNPCRSAEPVQ